MSREYVLDLNRGRGVTVGSTGNRTRPISLDPVARTWACIVVIVLALAPGAARADLFSSYTLAGSFTLPAPSPFDVLPDGRLITLSGADVYTEPSLGARVFSRLGTLPGMDVPGYASAFVRVSPDGTQLAVGNNGGASYNNYQVGVFSIANLTGAWFPATHFDARWFDGTHLALTAGAPGGTTSQVSLLDVASNPSNPANPVVVTHIGGAAGGITFDVQQHLFTGNGYSFGGPSQTGWVKAFAAGQWLAALHGGAPVDFEDAGTLIGDVSSAASLGFDPEGNLYAGGGAVGAQYAGLVRASAVAHALGGGGPALPQDIRQFDPAAPDPYRFYDVNVNFVTGELYVRNAATVWVYTAPEPGALVLLGSLYALARRGRR